MAQQNCSGFNVSNGISQNTKCAERDVFHREGHILIKLETALFLSFLVV